MEISKRVENIWKYDTRLNMVKTGKVRLFGHNVESEIKHGKHNIVWQCVEGGVYEFHDSN